MRPSAPWRRSCRCKLSGRRAPLIWNHTPRFTTRCCIIGSSWWGSSETAVRFPSALMSLINVGLLYGLGSRLANQRVALLAAALLAVSPLNIWYAQEARMYVFIAGAALLYALLLTWDSWWALPLLTLTLTLAACTPTMSCCCPGPGSARCGCCGGGEGPPNTAVHQLARQFAPRWHPVLPLAERVSACPRWLL